MPQAVFRGGGGETGGGEASSVGRYLSGQAPDCLFPASLELGCPGAAVVAQGVGGAGVWGGLGGLAEGQVRAPRPTCDRDRGDSAHCCPLWSGGLTADHGFIRSGLQSWPWTAAGCAGFRCYSALN